MSEVSRIIDELSREHDGDPWHGSPLLHILEGLSASHAAAHPIAGAHSIWEILLHVTAWKKEVRRRLAGAEAALPQDGDWPPVGEATEQRWREARVRLQEAHGGLTRALRDFPEEKLLEPTNDKRDRSIGSGVSYYVLLHGIVQHDVYHAAQIAILKKGLSL
ncbi:MAG: hypothetical protein A3H96_10260 [Acidobacteria bacterium RIFCSPLOWO2_02_FULL_67_36]|nr:MAG: hypothetical protein A3H96_10260 [Acidobacteria bacterium RIFCSPLOWO2_02_FULL_67_36]OFW24436.1 MAG: hypothetical protein A3G21_17905 [Acidobacteria bacterium RIFCSPLOWO2_12_FULL_66_21]